VRGSCCSSSVCAVKFSSVTLFRHALQQSTSYYTDDYMHLLLACRCRLPSHLFSNVSTEAQDFIRQLLVKDPAHRMTAAQVCVYTIIAAASSAACLYVSSAP
jgi:serine/threonine protein kinase